MSVTNGGGGLMGLTVEELKKMKQNKPELFKEFNKLSTKFGERVVSLCMVNWVGNVKKRASARRLIERKEKELEELKKEFK